MKKVKNKIKIEKNAILKNHKIAMQSLLIIIVTLAITLPIHYLVSTYNWYWVIFTWIAIFAPIMVVNFKSYSEDKFSLTPEQIKNGNARLILLILWYWYVDIVYMVIFNHWTVWIYILVTIAMIKIFYDLVETSLNSKIKNSLYTQTMIINFLIGIGLIVYLIFLIKNADLRNIVTAIVASAYGGLLTLVGVAWTIKHTNDEKKEEETKKNRPFIFVVDPRHTTAKPQTKVLLDDRNVCKDLFKKGNKYHINSFVLENADYSYSSIKGLCINKKIIPMNIAQSFRKKEQYYIIIDFDFLCSEYINEISLLLIDMLDNYYILKVNFILQKDGRNHKTVINIVSGIEIIKAKVDFNNLTVEEIKD